MNQNAEYISIAQHNRMKRMAVAAILMTEVGLYSSMQEIAKRVGCCARTVSSVKSDLRQLDLLAAYTERPPVATVPLASYSEAAMRVDMISEWLRELDHDGVRDETLLRAQDEVTAIRRKMLRRGDKSRAIPKISAKLDDLETLMERPEYELVALSA